MSLERLFGQILQLARLKSGLSQEQLGFDSGYHRTYISLLERGRKSPSLKTLFRLAQALQIDASNLIIPLEKAFRKTDKTKSLKRKGR
jgi:transcriptional regulator with XRE-family HTH domain